ncbi:hypothetical protein KIPB_006878 [Kipferlia bialata]|uniref:Uncharacterized protein n=1 Tax=Kipferlia bialata TaxID=797122 RepID=A0A9K3GK52_9EUKA|nr:hypothetical protein KIPB_006878 [Kipferlia bialata]|eukprot:g6878.t1
MPDRWTNFERWKINRAHHQEVNVVNRVLQMIEVSFLFGLGYSEFMVLLRDNPETNGPLGYAFPILVIVMACTTGFTNTIHTLHGYTLYHEGIKELDRLLPEMQIFVSPMYLLPNILRVGLLFVTVLVQGFLLTEFFDVEIYYTSLFPVLALAFSIALGLVVFYLVRVRVNRQRGPRDVEREMSLIPMGVQPLSPDSTYSIGLGEEAEDLEELGEAFYN